MTLIQKMRITYPKRSLGDSRILVFKEIRIGILISIMWTMLQLIMGVVQRSWVNFGILEMIEK